jgi:hypothetical protein
MPSDERRSFSRIPFDADTQIRQGSNAWSVVLIDVSLKGLLIEEPFGWNIDSDTPATATIILDDGSSITMSVLLRHAENKQVGFECDHIDIESISLLRRLVEINLGDSDLLERELSALGQGD